VLVRDGMVAVVHRPTHGDWCLPKGKLEPGEDDEAAAVREVREETGFSGLIEGDLGETGYVVVRDGRQRPKRVRWFLMRATGGAFTPGREADELRWLAPADADALLHHPGERDVLYRARPMVAGPRPS
jgi:8-oxo-dGTP pyrophosphatase MutT (NUDIX family)